MSSRQQLKTTSSDRNKQTTKDSKNSKNQVTITSLTKDKDYQTIDDLINMYMSFDSKILSEPIINPSNFHAALEKELPKESKEKMILKLIQYPILKDSLSQCSAFPTKHRKLIYEYLFSLPHNDKVFKLYEERDTHPFYRFLD